MRRVVIESPYAGDVDRNVAYARAAMRDSLARGECPFLSHLLYTQVLDDEDAGERLAGMIAGVSWMSVAEAVVVYEDLGVSRGMSEGIKSALNMKLPVEYRRIGWAPEASAP